MIFRQAVVVLGCLTALTGGAVGAGCFMHFSGSGSLNPSVAVSVLYGIVLLLCLSFLRDASYFTAQRRRQGEVLAMVLLVEAAAIVGFLGIVVPFALLQATVWTSAPAWLGYLGLAGGAVVTACTAILWKHMYGRGADP